MKPMNLNMNSAEALVAQIQGLSGNIADLNHLHNYLKQSDDSLFAEATRLAPLLSELDATVDSLGYLYILKSVWQGDLRWFPLGPPLLSYSSNCKAMLTAVDGAVQLVTDRPYKSGQPIVVWCGPQPNSKLLINYGFVDEDNSCDRVVVEASLSVEDPQYQDKRLSAQRNGKLSVYVGKEREVVMDMLPYLRLGYVSDTSEMQFVLFYPHKVQYVQ